MPPARRRRAAAAAAHREGLDGGHADVGQLGGAEVAVVQDAANHHGLGVGEGHDVGAADLHAKHNLDVLQAWRGGAGAQARGAW